MKLYAINISPPCRAVMLALDVLGLDYEFVKVNLLEGEHLKPEFVKMNPQHAVPVLEDDGLVLTESKAIMIYLAQKYDAKKTLMPECPSKAAVVHQRLYFESGTVFTRFAKCFYANVFGGNKDKPSDEDKNKIKEGFTWVEDFIKPTGFFAGTDSMTIADLALLALYSSVAQTKGVYVNLDDFPETKKWFAKMKTLVPNYEKADGEGASAYGNMFATRTGF